MEWRDGATLAAMALIHAASASTMRMLEKRLDEVAVMDAISRAHAVARDIVRPAMRAEVGPPADDWFKEQARALRQIDARLETLALRFASMSDRPTLPQDEVAAINGRSATAWLRGTADTIGAAIERSAAGVANRTLPDVVRESAEQVSVRIVREFGERSGAHDRLRVAAHAELLRVWLGPAAPDATTQPYLTQMLDVVDCTTKKALETII